MNAPKPYEGPFNPPPEESMLPGVIAWRHVKMSDGPGRWRPEAWEIIYPDHILTVDYSTGIGVKVALLHAP